MLFSPPFFWIPFLLLFRRHCDVTLFNPSSCLSRSCSAPTIFSRSAAQIIPFFSLSILFLTGVSCPLFKFYHLIKFLFNYFLFNRSASRIWSSLIPFLNRSVFYIYLALQPQGFLQCSLSLFSNGVFLTLFTFVVFFSRICSTS